MAQLLPDAGGGGLVRQSSYGSLTSTGLPSSASMTRSSSLSSIITGNLENGYKVPTKNNMLNGNATSIKASMNRRAAELCQPGGGVGNSKANLGLGMSRAKNSVLDAAVVGDLPALRRLLDGGSIVGNKLDLNNKDAQGKNCLMHAVTTGNKDVVEYLLLKRADVNAIDNSQKSVLHHASKRARTRRTAQAFAGACDERGVILALLQGRAQVDLQDDNGCTALMLAVASGNVPVARSLLVARANVNTRDSDGQTCLECAVSFEHTELVQMLKDPPQENNVQRPAAPARGAGLNTAMGSSCGPTASHPRLLAARDRTAVSRFNVLEARAAASDSSSESDDLEVETSWPTREVTTTKTRAEVAIPARVKDTSCKNGKAETEKTQAPAKTSAEALAEAPAEAPPVAVVESSEPEPAKVSKVAEEADESKKAAISAKPEIAENGEEKEKKDKKEKKEKKDKKEKKEKKEKHEDATAPAAAAAAVAAAAAAPAEPEKGATKIAEEGATKEAEEKTKKEAEEKAKREAEEAEEKAKQKAEEAAKREAEEKARQQAAEEAARREAEENKQRLLEHMQQLMQKCSDVKSESELEESLKELKAAIKAAQASGVEAAKIGEAETHMKDVKARGKAQEKLKQAMADRDLDKLRKALSKAEEANVFAALIEEAKVVIEEEQVKQKLREQLRAAAEAGDKEQLKSALKAAKKAKLQASELTLFEEVLTKLELKMQAEKELKQAVESRSIDELKAAIAKAQEAGASSELLSQAEAVLAEEEPKQKARELLQEACTSGAIPALQEAIKAAEDAKLDASEYADAAELLRREEEKLAAMEAVRAVVEEVKTVDIKSIDALKEAKDKLTRALQDANQAGVPESEILEAEKRRKKLHNGIEDLKGSIRVFCRIRPLSSKEKEAGDTSVTSASGTMTLNLEGYGAYNFDAVFTPGTQDEVFEDCKDLVQSALDGYNVTMFAYGQTGAGKTFTMYGAPGMEGTAPRTIQEIYTLIDRDKSRFDFKVTGSMMELYTQHLVDLLAKGSVTAGKSKSLNIKMEKSGAVAIENLTSEACESAEQLQDLLERGNAERTVAATAMNSESSRSHLVFMIRIESINKETGETTKGKILICDLAGSERLKKSMVSEAGQKEAIEINKSLTALGNVIEALTKGAKIVPYREHKLTQLMQDSLGGTAKTLMFVNCSPANSNTEETAISLKYATRAKKITNTAQKN